MESVANSRRIKHISFIDCYDHTIDNQASKSLRSYIMKLKHTSSSQVHKELPLCEAPPKKIKSAASSFPLAEYQSRKCRNSMKNHQLPLLENNEFRRHRHTLDLSNMKYNYNLGVIEDIHTSNLCNSSIFCTFISSPLNYKASFSSGSSSTSCINKEQTLKESADFHMENEICANNENTPVFSLSQKQGETEDPYYLQRRLWKQDMTLCPKEDIATYLGQDSFSRSKVLHLYMCNFDFSNQTLDEAFRALCQKLLLKAESQQIDRIIKAFSKRYYTCNPTTLYHSVDVIHTVAYSILLLNTDLHIVNDKANRMTKSNFVKNTMETIQSIAFLHPNEHIRRTSLVSDHGSDTCSIDDCPSPSTITSGPPMKYPDEMKEEQSIHSYHSGSMIYALKSIMSKKSNHTLTSAQKQWLMEIENTLKVIFTSIKSHCIETIPFDEKKAMTKDTYRIFEGHVMCKHEMIDNEKRANHRRWQPSYLVLTQSEMIVYSLKRKNKLRIMSIQTLHQSHCQPDGEQVAVIPMHRVNVTIKHSLNTQRAHVFKLETEEGGVWLFETIDDTTVKSWIDACHHAITKLSMNKPLPKAVCNTNFK